MTAPETPWKVLPEVQAYARMGRSEILAALNDGSLRGHQTKAGGRWRVHRDDIDAWLRGEPPAPIRSTLARKSA